MLPNLGPGEIIVILALALLIFGPKKLPEIGKGIGKALREFNRARNDFMDSLHADADGDEAPERTVPTSRPGAETATSAASRAEDFDDEDNEALPYGSAYQPVMEPATAGATPALAGGAGSSARADYGSATADQDRKE